ncbi:hypothetical protein [Methylophaga sp.]|uniref:hypothetical protein n=1 Tax=Methylophaga sp. TaxID=2024840 RepID=UPI003A8F722F
MKPSSAGAKSNRAGGNGTGDTSKEVKRYSPRMLVLMDDPLSSQVMYAKSSAPT